MILGFYSVFSVNFNYFSISESFLIVPANTVLVHFLPHVDDPGQHEVIRFALAGKLFSNGSQSSSLLPGDDENILLRENASNGEDRIKA